MNNYQKAGVVGLTAWILFLYCVWGGANPVLGIILIVILIILL